MKYSHLLVYSSCSYSTSVTADTALHYTYVSKDGDCKQAYSNLV